VSYTTPTPVSSGHVVTAAEWNQNVVDNVLFLADPPRVKVTVGALSIPNATATGVTWSASSWNTDSNWSHSTHPTRLTSNTAGYYQIDGQSLWNNTTNTGQRGVSLWQNGIGSGTMLDVETLVATTSGVNVPVHASAIAYLAVGDYVELDAYQDCGGSLSLVAGWFQMRWVAL
jgi:hypothetical protein